MRIICIGTNFGFAPQIFWPEGEGADWKPSMLLKSLDRHRQDFTIFQGLDHGQQGVGGHSGIHAYLSGILSKHSRGFEERNISIDQKAAAHAGAITRFPSMQISSAPDQNNRMSWSSSGVAVPSISDLRHLFALLFQNPDEGQLDVLQGLYTEQKSVLDLVAHDAAVLGRQVGKADQEKIDQFFTSVRELERRLTQNEDWLRRPKPEVPWSLPESPGDMDFVDRVPLYYDIAALALQTDSSRSITLEFSDIGPNLGGFPITRGYHQLTHHGKVEAYLEELSIIERFHTDQFARFLDRLKETEEPGGGRLLDNTMVLFGSGMGNASSHSNKNLPLILAGGGFNHGSLMRFEKDSTPACNLFVSMLQRFGCEVDQFGTSTGSLTGLEVA